ncbi:UNVERIFIED_CONTAM: hypothetical protein Sradi_2251500 [Sesamum radiatum]|uniref:Vesicle transport protein n=1 Tax=Sesamum radiatum TaxID=300843 RepID=A0AAW2T418_SESRA
MQNWFSGGFGDNENSVQRTASSSSSSLLADWNSYATARSSEESSSGASLGGVFDIEAAVRSANDTVSGTFNVGYRVGKVQVFKHQETKPSWLAASLRVNVWSKDIQYSLNTIGRVTKGVKDLPGNFQSATSSIPSGKALMYFGLLLGSGVFFIFIAFTLFLPVIVLVPQKFAICFTVGCAFIIGSFFALRGPKNQFNHMFSKEVLDHFYIISHAIVFLDQLHLR